MSPLFLALGASLAWGFADFFGPLVSRTLGSLRVLFWAQVGGVLAIALAVAIRGQGPAGWAVLFAICASFGGMLGPLRLLPRDGGRRDERRRADRTAIVRRDPVVFGIATGDSPRRRADRRHRVRAPGVGLASVEHHEGQRRVAAGAGVALLAALGFGFYFRGCTPRARSTSGGRR